jgi:hypothetical protein
MFSPQDRYVVALDERVNGRDGQVVPLCLRDEDAVKGISVERRQLGELYHARLVNRQAGNLMSFTLPGKVRIGRFWKWKPPRAGT